MNKKEKQAIEVLKSPLLKSDGYERHQKAINTILELVEKQEKEIEKYKKQVDLEYVEENYIEKSKAFNKDKIKQILGYEEDEEVTEEQILFTIETMNKEFNRLEDLEDKMDTQYISRNKIKQEIKEIIKNYEKDSDYTVYDMIEALEELLKNK